MLIKDFVVLGLACPEPLKDGRVTVCMAGWCDALGFVRIYPTSINSPCRRWDIIELEVERTEKDTRDESWKIQGSKSDWEILHTKIKIKSRIDDVKSRRDLIGNLTDSCVNVLNDEKRSLGIIKPQILKYYFTPNDDYGKLMQMGLPGMTELDSVLVKRNYPDEPRITYQCPDCQTQNKKHDQQVLEWGFFEWMRKNPDNIAQVWQNARMGKENTDHYFLVGNQVAHRNSFMIISVFYFPQGEVTVPMFPHKKITRA